MLHASPDITCWEGGHIPLVASSIVFFLLYVVGIPVSLGLLLHYYKVNNLLNDAEVKGLFVIMLVVIFVAAVALTLGTMLRL